MGNKVSSASAAPKAVDWTGIRRSARSFTFEELSHSSIAGVNPYTVQLVHALCSQFTLSSKAKRELEATRGKLSAATADAMHNVLLDLVATDQGLIALAICGILNESFEQESLGIVFEVLAKSALFESNAVPKDLIPPNGSWAELNQLCGRLEAPNTFHDLVERYSHLEPVGAHLEQTGPLGIVDSLQIMTEPFSGDPSGPITSYAGRHAGWYAAVAEWMFDLKIQIAAEDGRVLYSNCEGHEELLQLIVTFHNRGVPCEGDPIEDLPLRTKEVLT